MSCMEGLLCTGFLSHSSIDVSRYNAIPNTASYVLIGNTTSSQMGFSIMCTIPMDVYALNIKEMEAFFCSVPSKVRGDKCLTLWSKQLSDIIRSPTYLKFQELLTANVTLRKLQLLKCIQKLRALSICNNMLLGIRNFLSQCLSATGFGMTCLILTE